VGRICPFLVFFLIAGQLRWQELWWGWRRAPRFSINKAPSFSLWRLLMLALLHSVSGLPKLILVKPPIWWCSERDYIGEALFNKRALL
jgi:hypothetical protein